MATEYPGVKVPAEEDVSMDIIYRYSCPGRREQNPYL
jgi:hypothetical protein